MKPPIIVVIVALAVALGPQAACEPEPAEGEGEGEGEPPVVFIGDPEAPAELELVIRTIDGDVAPLVDNGEVPLILPPQGGKVVLVGVRGRNVTQNLQVNAGFFDECQDPPLVIGREGRPVKLVDDGTGTGIPDVPAELLNYANIPVCPTFASSRDGEGQPYRLELRATEQRRPGEEVPRSHVLTATVTPVCAEAEIAEDCRCECDASFNIEQSREEQCPTIHDDDIEPGACPSG